MSESAPRPAAQKEQPAWSTSGATESANGGPAIGVDSIDIVVALDFAREQAGSDRPDDGPKEGNEDARLRVKAVATLQATHGVDREGNALEGRSDTDGHGNERQSTVLTATRALHRVGHGGKQPEAEVGDEGNEGVRLVPGARVGVAARVDPVEERGDVEKEDPEAGNGEARGAGVPLVRTGARGGSGVCDGHEEIESRSL